MASYTRKEVADKVNEIVHEQLGVNMEQIVDSANYVDDLGADSLDCIELVMAFEEEFGRAIPEEDAEKIDTVGKTIDYLCEVLGVDDKSCETSKDLEEK